MTQVNWIRMNDGQPSVSTEMFNSNRDAKKAIKKSNPEKYEKAHRKAFRPDYDVYDVFLRDESVV